MPLAVLLLVTQAAAVPSGHWEGAIRMPNRELRITIDLAKGPSGVWIGSMSVPGSTSVDVPLTSLVVENAAVRFVAAVPENASFDGVISDDGQAFAGKASNAEGSAEFRLARTGEANVKVPPPSSALPPEFAGAWEATVESEGVRRRVGLRFSPAADGTPTGLLIAIDRGNQEIPISTVTVSGRQLDFESRALSGTFHGTLDQNGEISGEWSEGGRRFPLTFRRAAAAPPQKQG